LDLSALDKKVRLIEIRSRKAAQNIFSGRYKSIFRGQGMEFDEVREYQYGDDIKNIDWNVTARSNHLYTKKFMEERELTINILLDVSHSLKFGTKGRLKSELAVETAALISLAALKNGDKVGLTLFSEKVEKYYRPQKKRDHIFQVIRDILVYPPISGKSKLTNAIEFIQKVQRKRSIIFILSDMIVDNYEHALYLLSKRHDVFVFFVADPAEKTLSNLSAASLADLEEDYDVSLHPFRDVKNEEKSLSSFFNRHKDALLRKNIKSCELLTDRDPINDLVRFFNQMKVVQS